MVAAVAAVLGCVLGARLLLAHRRHRAVLPDPEQCELLKTNPQTPLLSVERIAYTYNDAPMEMRRGLPHVLLQRQRHGRRLSIMWPV